MIIDGRAIAATIIATIKTHTATLPAPPTLTVFTCAPNFETQKFLTLKRRWAEEAGIQLVVTELPALVTLAEVASEIQHVVSKSDGIIIQFPFPHLATTDLISLIPPSHDVDVLRYDGRLENPLPPVVGAIDIISRQYHVDWMGRVVVVVGSGRLVGIPAAAYATAKGARVIVVTKEQANLAATALADIIILGAGSPGLLTAATVKPGAVVFDAGTSEEGGVLVGDADPAVAHTAALFTPVPGGIGPLTVAVLLHNVLTLAATRK